MSIDYDKLRRELDEMEAGAHVTTRYTWADLARELLGLRDGTEAQRDMCARVATLCRSSNDPNAPAVASNLESVARALTDLLEGDTK